MLPRKNLFQATKIDSNHVADGVVKAFMQRKSISNNSAGLVAKKVGRAKKAIDVGKSVKGLSPKAKVALGLGTAAVVGGVTAHKFSKERAEKV